MVRIVTKLLVTGSKALEHHGLALTRKPRDLDAIASLSEYEALRKGADVVLEQRGKRFGTRTLFMVGREPHELEIADDSSTSQELLDMEGTGFAKPEVVLAMKMSHRYLKDSPHFKKTMDDILWLRGLGYSVPSRLKDWLKRREKATYDYAHPKLNQSKNEFFTDTVQYVYDHDSIHRAVKIFDAPAYESFKVDDAEVLCSKEKFVALPKERQLASVLEESYVLALERHQIPNGYRPSAKTSFLLALEKVCTSITSGWWREFAWEHYYEVLDRYSTDYVIKFHQGVNRGEVIKL